MSDDAFEPLEVTGQLLAHPGTYQAEDALDRRAALVAATQLESATEGPARIGITELADRLYGWLRARPSIVPAFLRLIPGQVTEQNGDPAMAATLDLIDTQQVPFTVQPLDSKGEPTTDGQLTWTTPDDPGAAVVSLAVSDDTLSCVVSAVAPGTATLTVTDPAGITGSELIVVTPGPVASLVLQAGTPGDEPSGS